MRATKKQNRKLIKRVNFDVDAGLHTGIKIVCAAEGISLAAFGRQAISERIAKFQRSRPGIGDGLTADPLTPKAARRDAG